eukprot:CAMPEP_0206183734 /NCGR_PEP_ID=MMETSP0166-20121206/808_1 /ASSEMBLY_ACC=CAM_ASM_000260 /TAXON_ID=95228 /ORGANISM="Vannella robusta, Strain DIVA3 518/3/11/1/6" /LENGTH=240 /DNA_ID=CAMNT_0053598633 /DNA_START=110 /DNA_END=829 /DNA_ORIENTATION=-
MTITWIQSKASKEALVSYYATKEGAEKTKTELDVSVDTYEEGGWLGFIYSCTLGDLIPSVQYNYTVGTEFGELQEPYTFTACPKIEASSGVRFIAYGDMGDISHSREVMGRVNEHIKNENVNLVLHLGDIAYAGGDQSIWDSWMRNISPIAATIPYMAIEGNHERDYQFAAYNHRFRNPGNESGSYTTKYYSFDYGNIHFLGFTFEDFLDLDNNPEFGAQREWIIADLKEANENRHKTPW